MPLPALIVPILLSVAVAEDAPIIVKAFPWAPFISPMGEAAHLAAERREADAVHASAAGPSKGAKTHRRDAIGHRHRRISCK